MAAAKKTRKDLMTRTDWEERALRAAEKTLRIPPGWWGTYRDVHGPDRVRIRYSGRCWTVRHGMSVLGKYDSRAYAIGVARKALQRLGKDGGT